MGCIGTLMGLDVRGPDYSTLSRRANGVSIAQVMRQAGSVPIHLVVDRTGLKIFGEGDWNPHIHLATNRLAYGPNSRFDYTIGFRCARSL